MYDVAVATAVVAHIILYHLKVLAHPIMSKQVERAMPSYSRHAAHVTI